MKKLIVLMFALAALMPHYAAAMENPSFSEEKEHRGPFFVQRLPFFASPSTSDEEWVQRRQYRQKTKKRTRQEANQANYEWDKVMLAWRKTLQQQTEEQAHGIEQVATRIDCLKGQRAERSTYTRLLCKLGVAHRAEENLRETRRRFKELPIERQQKIEAYLQAAEKKETNPTPLNEIIAEEEEDSEYEENSEEEEPLTLFQVFKQQIINHIGKISFIGSTTVTLVGNGSTKSRLVAGLFSVAPVIVNRDPESCLKALGIIAISQAAPEWGPGLMTMWRNSRSSNTLAIE